MRLLTKFTNIVRIMMIGCDTGFFIQLIRKQPQAIKIWKELRDQQEQALVCCLSLFELKRIFLKGILSAEEQVVFLDAIGVLCKTIWLDNHNSLLNAAQLSHGTSIPAMDAIILESLIENGATTIYTTDVHLLLYEKKGIKIVNLLK